MLASTGVGEAAVSSPAWTTTKVDDGSAQVKYAGAWQKQSGKYKYGGSDHWSATRGSTATFTFTGSGVTLVGAKAPWHGKAFVSVDGKPATTVDLYNSVRKDRQQLFTKDGLEHGTHTLRVTVAGTRHASSKGTTVAIDNFAVVRRASVPVAVTPTTAPSSTGKVVLYESGNGAAVSSYASKASNGTHPLWHIEGGSTPISRSNGTINKSGTAQFHRVFSNDRFGGPGKELKITYRARATDIRNRPGSSIVEGAKVGLKWPMPQSHTGYPVTDPRSVYGKRPGFDPAPGAYMFLTGITEGGYVEMSKNGLGAEGYSFFPNKRLGYTEGTWKDVTVTVEWLDSNTMRVRYWHNTTAAGPPIYEVVDRNAGAFAKNPAFLWLRTDDTDWQYDYIKVEEFAVNAGPSR